MIKFSKMHGLGNDFMVIDGVNQLIDPSQLPVAKWGDRHLGIGFDQLLFIERSAKADIACRIYNSDGSIAEQCGNGLRCVARFINDMNIIPHDSFTIETRGGIFTATLREDNLVQVNMGVPLINSETTTLRINNESFALHILSMGNPHAVIFLGNIENYPVDKIGSMIATNSIFPQGTNVGFVEIIDRQNIKLRTFERGVGETFACGSNACASAVAGIISQALDSNVIVRLPLGHLLIEWQGNGNPVTMTGPVKHVFDGTVE